MIQEEAKKMFADFLKGYDAEKERLIWMDHEKTFRAFWATKILPSKKADNLSEADYDPIIRLIDVKAKGFNRETDVAVAHVGLYQGTWYRIFNDLVEKEDIKRTLDKIFKSGEDRVLIEMINRLEKENDPNKNGLTGKNANALNALLFINDPDRFISSISLAHRFQIIKAFEFGDPDSYRTYGEKIVNSNRDIIVGFKEKFGIEASPRTISGFIYYPPIVKFWKKDEGIDEAILEKTEESADRQSEFAIEKHLEDFLVANWESTELGKSYDLIEEDGDMVSQQFPTDIGRIDLLVKGKKDGGYVVIELKRGQTGDDTAGQLARYMAWVKENKAGGKGVKGIVIANGIDKKLEYALKSIPNTKTLIYKIYFTLEQK